VASSLVGPVRLVRLFPLALAGLAALLAVAARPEPAPLPGEAVIEPVDLMTFAQGAVPISVISTGAARGASFEHAVRAIDGDPRGFTLVNQGSDATVTELVYALPAPTTFDRFAVPNVLETPSPSATFSRRVEVHGSATSAEEGFVLLASATLSTHARKGERTALAIAERRAVRFVKLRLEGGIDLPRGTGSLEFSELIGHGTQAPAPLVDAFTGRWKRGASTLVLIQSGPAVSGCYDRSGDLTGTIGSGILRATGVDRSDGTKSAFILSVAPDGSLRGVRSSNGGPFTYYTAPTAADGDRLDCAAPAPRLGCGSTIHGIGFDYDSAALRPDAEPVLDALQAGLASETSASITIEGHTSSEGSTAYNERLSEQRAAAVVADLVRRGIAADRLRAVGVGEARPIAREDDENGRALNRRVEIVCR